MTGRPGKWPWKNHSVAVTPLSPTIRFALGVVLDDAVDDQERPAMRDQRLDLAASCGTVTRARWRGPVGVCGAASCRSRLCRGGRAVIGAAAAQEAALPTRSSRFVVMRPSRNVALSSSARWMRHVGDDAVDDELVERDARRARSPSSRSGPQTMSLPSSES